MTGDESDAAGPPGRPRGMSGPTASGASAPPAPDPDPGPRPVLRWVSLGVGALLLVFVGLLATRESGDRQVGSPLLGEVVPSVVGTTIDGEPLDIDELRGQWVVVNFFASWCAPCIVEHPELVAFQERHRDTGDAQVVSIAFDDAPADARAFFEERGGEWPVLAEATASIAIDFGVTGVPETYLVDPNGFVQAKWISTIDADDLDGAIAALTGGRG